jgi:hypothetical protein
VPHSKVCLRSNGTERAWFSSKEEAEAFGRIAPGYEGDIAHLCLSCGFWHLARVKWLRDENYLTSVASFTEGVN